MPDEQRKMGAVARVFSEPRQLRWMQVRWRTRYVIRQMLTRDAVRVRAPSCGLLHHRYHRGRVQSLRPGGSIAGHLLLLDMRGMNDDKLDDECQLVDVWPLECTRALADCVVAFISSWRSMPCSVSRLPTNHILSGQ